MTRFISFAQNGEDVVLWRALGHIESGTYLDIGANDPDLFSVTRAFYDRGWSGLCIEPEPTLVEKFKAERPRDTLLQGIISDSESESVTFYAIAGTGLSTMRDDVADEHRASGRTVVETSVASWTLVEAVKLAGLAGRDIHFAVIDTEGAELSVLRSAGFTEVRPWVLVIEATAPLSTRQVHQEWESVVLAAGYRFCLFDGLSRFYVDERNHPELIESLSYPAGVFDDFATVGSLELERLANQARAEVEELRHTFSWRITAPLRAVRRATSSMTRRRHVDRTPAAL
jgi:FkbM family methyltransferase